jgi:hypothetical protein
MSRPKGTGAFCFDLSPRRRVGASQGTLPRIGRADEGDVSTDDRSGLRLRTRPLGHRAAVSCPPGHRRALRVS